MRCLYMGAAVMLVSLSGVSTLLACADHTPKPQPAEQYVPQSQPGNAQLASTVDGMKMAGASFGGAILACSIA